MTSLPTGSVISLHLQFPCQPSAAPESPLLPIPLQETYQISPCFTSLSPQHLPTQAIKLILALHSSLSCAISLCIPVNIRIQSIPPQPAATYPRRPPLLLIALPYLRRPPSLPRPTLARIIRAPADKPDAPLVSPTTETDSHAHSEWSPSDRAMRLRPLFTKPGRLNGLRMT